ncbi:PREDICTED: transmembrane protein 220-like [Priapulus caudatus]|uniref:Transmembrane protein 220-like n=1 Tax=Priapulus caudatus TaxID=37621 RepID=A0ABM1FB09_PRICU|nr:PREDICTED: transmembrane protein 220-like [Priapulus caudatus]
MIYLIYMTVLLLEGKIANPLQHEEGREMGGVIIVIAWLVVCYIKRAPPSGDIEASFQREVGTLLLVTTIIGLAPLMFWALCLWPGVSDSMAHCASSCQTSDL